jgi:hypothetical protein
MTIISEQLTERWFIRWISDVHEYNVTNCTILDSSEKWIEGTVIVLIFLSRFTNNKCTWPCRLLVQFNHTQNPLKSKRWMYLYALYHLKQRILSDVILSLTELSHIFLVKMEFNLIIVLKLVTKQSINHINIWFDYQQEEKEELSLSSIDTVFPSDWGTYGDLACHKLAFFTHIHLFSHLVFWDMFKNTFQSGFLSILYSIGSKPLQIWDKKVNWKYLSN